MTKIVAISDLHGQLPKLPSCDILLIGGDVCPVWDHSLLFQELWLNGNFLPWLKSCSAKYKVFVAGNHDFFFENYEAKPWSVFSNSYCRMKERSDIYYLQDNGVTLEGINLWGSPWQLPFFDWAFNLPDDKIKAYADRIPTDTDILILHSPPYGYGDKVFEDDEEGLPKVRHAGSHSYLYKIMEVQPKLVVFGHIHDGYGQYQVGKTTLVNASYVDEHYRPINKPWELEV
jgi:Icc-related predicted phosphoesterase